MNKVTFRCKRSGNTVSFANDVDIDSMRKHEGYVEVKEDAQTTKTVEVRPKETPRKEVLKLKPKLEVPEFLKE